MFKVDSRVTLRWLAIVLALVGIAFSGALADERVLSFHSNITVESTGDFLVTETFRIRLGKEKSLKGMFRDIPSFPRGKMLRVQRNGSKEDWQISAGSKGGELSRVWIGKGWDAHGLRVHTFEIVYRVRAGKVGSSRGLADGRQALQDVLSWPINGTEWGLRFDRVSADVELPEGSGGQSAIISGGVEQGSNEWREDYRLIQKRGATTIEATRPLSPGETLRLEIRRPVPAESRGNTKESAMARKARERVAGDTKPSPSRRPGARGLRGERILSFHSDIRVERNGALQVTETIRVRALGREVKRGIYRDIPRLRTTRFGKTRNPLQVLAVTRDGKTEHYQTENIGRGGIRIRIGRRSVILKPGIYTYEITYRTERQLYHEEGRDALYWNVNGTEWQFPTDEVTATVTLPAGIKGTEIWGYTGKLNEKGESMCAGLSSSIRSSAFRRLCACLALLALARKRAM